MASFMGTEGNRAVASKEIIFSWGFMEFQFFNLFHKIKGVLAYKEAIFDKDF